MATKISSDGPVISVVMPTYNRAHTLYRSVGSLLNQTFEDFELIIVDDGSKDDTETVVRSFKDSRIRYLRHEHNKGAAAARNTGIRSSQAPYVAFLDSDDKWLPEKLEKQLIVFETTDLRDLGVVICGVTIFDRSGSRSGTPSRRGWVHQDLLALGGNMSNINMLIKRSKAEPELWFEESLGSSEEWDLQIRLSAVCQFDTAPEILIHKYEDSDDRVYLGENIPKWHAVILEKYEKEYQAIPGICARLWGGVCLHYWVLGQGSDARKAIIKAIKMRPLAPRFYVYLMCTLTGKVGCRMWRIFGRIRLPSPKEL